MVKVRLQFQIITYVVYAQTYSRDKAVDMCPHLRVDGVGVDLLRLHFEDGTAITRE